jgi:hypothetical protein
MAYEIGTDSYAKYVRKITPNQKSVKQNKENKKNLDEKSVSQQQQKLMGLAYAVKKGDISAPSAEIQKIADSMSIKELKKMAYGKHNNLPVKKEEVEVDEEVFNWYIIKGNTEKGKVAHVGTERDLKLKIRKPTFPPNHVLLKSRKDLKIGDNWKGSMGVSEEVEIDEGKFKMGDIVIPSIGPHEGEKHKIIHDFKNGTYNISLMKKDSKYDQGAAKAKENQLKLVQEDVVVPEEISNEDAAEFITKAAAAKKAGKKSFTLGGKKYPVTIKTDIPTETNKAVSLDGRTRLFKEKLKKLADEKAKRVAREQNREHLKNRVTINPIKEERRGFDLVKKYKKLQEEKILNSLEKEILNYIQEGTFKALPPSVPEHGESSDIPPSAMSIARAFKVSPMEVQSVLDKMVSMGTITRVGDAYSYGSTS